MLKRWSLIIFLISHCTVTPVAHAGSETTAARPADFAAWHLPLPAGEWTISRGPCGSKARFNHQCGYYEDACGVDLTPLNKDEAENVPVLAPQAGQVFFLGQRFDAGITVMLRHADGRLSALMHLSKAVVGLEEKVAQGQVVGYIGHTGSASAPHLHFHVQPNAVERECLDLTGLDAINYEKMRATSHNLRWDELTLIDPPTRWPEQLPLFLVTRPISNVIFPKNVTLAPNTIITVPIVITGSNAVTSRLMLGTMTLSPTLVAKTHALYHLPISATAATGAFTLTVRLANATLKLPYTVRRPPDTSPSQDMILISPTFVSPANWPTLTKPPKLCWSEPASAGKAPLQFRVLVVGPAQVESGWISDACWQAPTLKAGTYFWKVFVRDGRGYMNRTNQRPYAFVMK